MIDFLSFCLAAAFALDLLIGDPQWLPHPVRWIGRLILFFEKVLEIFFGRTYFSGILLTAIVVGASFILTWFVQWAAFQIHICLGIAVTIYFIYTSIAARQLDKESAAVYRELKRGRLPEARRKLSMIVGRDTDQLGEKEITRATVETVAESTVDGILSPFFFAALGGAPAAMAFKAASTLDSIVGHKTPRHLKMGWASARLDDLLNWIPARLARLVYPLAAFVVRLKPVGCWKISWRDGNNSPSPNSGISEAAAAGALGVQLGGVNYYEGEKHVRPFLGDPLRPLEPRDIPRAIAWMISSSVIFIIFVILIRTILIKLKGSFQ